MRATWIMWFGGCYVHKGPAAVRTYDGGWRGYASGNVACQNIRRSLEVAIHDAEKLEFKAPTP